MNIKVLIKVHTFTTNNERVECLYSTIYSLYKYYFSTRKTTTDMHKPPRGDYKITIEKNSLKIKSKTPLRY